MAIEQGHLQAYHCIGKAEDDDSDLGGRLINERIVSSTLNNLFENAFIEYLTDGHTSFRKLHLKLDSPGLEEISTVKFYISQPPTNPKTTVVLYWSYNGVYDYNFQTFQTVDEDIIEHFVSILRRNFEVDFAKSPGSGIGDVAIEEDIPLASINRTYSSGFWTQNDTEVATTLNVMVGTPFSYAHPNAAFTPVYKLRYETTTTTWTDTVREETRTLKVTFSGEGTGYQDTSGDKYIAKPKIPTYPIGTSDVLYAGITTLSQSYSSGTTLYLTEVCQKIFPSVVDNISVSGLWLFNHSVVESDVVVGNEDYSVSRSSTVPKWHSFLVTGSATQKTYSFSLPKPHFRITSMTVWFIHHGFWQQAFIYDRGWNIGDPAPGCTSGEQPVPSVYLDGWLDPVAANDNYEDANVDGIITRMGEAEFTLRMPPDDGTDLYVVYQTDSYEELISENVGTSGALPRTLTFSNADVCENSVRLTYTSGGKSWPVYDDGTGKLMVYTQGGIDVLSESTRFEELNDLDRYPLTKVVYSDFCSTMYLCRYSYIYKSTDGLTWTEETNAIANGHNRIAGNGSTGFGYIQIHFGSGTDTEIYRRTGPGACSGAFSLTAAVSNEGAMYDVTTAFGLFIIVGQTFARTSPLTGLGAGSTWTTRTTPANTYQMVATGVDSSGVAMVMAAGGYQDCVKTYDGVTWTDIPSFNTGQVTGGHIYYTNNIVCDTVNRTWVIGCRQGMVAVTDDDGATWKYIFLGLQEYYSSVNNYTYVTSDGAGNLYAATDNYEQEKAEVYISRDGGFTWTRIVNKQFSNNAYVPNFLFYNTAIDKLCSGWSPRDNPDAIDNVIWDELGLMGSTDGGTGQVGTINYSAGTGSLTHGLAPSSSVAAKYLTRTPDTTDFAFHCQGYRNITNFSISARTMADATSTITLSGASTLSGDGTGTLDAAKGIGEVSFSEDVDPVTIQMSFSGDAYRATAPESNEGLNMLHNQCSPDGCVRIFQKGQEIVISDGDNKEFATVEEVWNDRIIIDASLDNTYDSEDTYVSSMSEYYDTDYDNIVAAEVTWNKVRAVGWSGTPGSDSWGTASGYDDTFDWDWTTYPVVLTNAGTVWDEFGIWVMSVVSPGVYTVNVYQRYVYSGASALIAEGVTVGVAQADLAPINPVTSVPFFTLPTAGWANIVGAGSWAEGHLIRINTKHSDKAVWVIRNIDADSTAGGDTFKIRMRVKEA